MISLLRGTLAGKSPSRIIVDVGGVGYDVQVPLSTFYVLGDEGATISLRIHTHVREDVIALFGFASGVEHDLFERLIAINGIGPKLALAVLSGIEPAELIRAVRNQDVARLTAIPGVGKKTAERIGLELKDRLPAASPSDVVAPSSPRDQLKDDLLSALLNLGYQRTVAEKAIERTLEGGSETGFETALKGTLKRLMKQ
jgi:Holliday junction DNA helicase RuvA